MPNTTRPKRKREGTSLTRESVAATAERLKSRSHVSGSYNRGDPTASINWGDDAKWGFNLDDAGDHNWVDMSWAKNGMGLSIGFASESVDFGWDAECSDGVSADEAACDTAEGDWTEAYAGSDYSGFDLAWGKTMSFGDFGVGYNSLTQDGAGAETEMWVNWRGSMDVWVFDSAKADFSMTDDGDGTTGFPEDLDDVVTESVTETYEFSVDVEGEETYEVVEETVDTVTEVVQDGVTVQQPGTVTATATRKVE